MNLSLPGKFKKRNTSEPERNLVVFCSHVFIIIIIIIFIIIIFIIIFIIIIISILDFKFPTSGITDYVINRNMRRLTAVTVCLWMRSADQTNTGTPFSYAVSASSNELLLFDYKDFEIIMDYTAAR